MVKLKLIEMAFEKLGLSPSVYGITPEQYESTLIQLDAMMAEWESNGIRCGYNMGATLNSESGAPESANQAIYSNLAISISGDYGKQISASLSAIAAKGLDALQSKTANQIQEMKYPAGMPVGQGMRRYTNRTFMGTTQEPLTIGADSNIIIN